MLVGSNMNEIQDLDEDQSSEKLSYISLQDVSEAKKGESDQEVEQIYHTNQGTVSCFLSFIFLYGCLFDYFNQNFYFRQH